MITKEEIDYTDTHGNAIKQFNDNLKLQLSKHIFEIETGDKAALHKSFYVHQSAVKKILLFIPALVGLLVHAPLYYFTKWLGDSLIKEDGHDDSKLIAFLFIFYPVVLIIVSAVLYLLTQNLFSFVSLLILPFTAWAFVQLKKQLD
jgi:hypothetical protein